jgi:hypothetical protein
MNNSLNEIHRLKSFTLHYKVNTRTPDNFSSRRKEALTPVPRSAFRAPRLKGACLLPLPLDL